jgi:hypothetical protein
MYVIHSQGIDVPLHFLERCFMGNQRARFWIVVLGTGLGLSGICWSQEASPTPADLPAAPKGVEVLARGPVHEAFATPAGEPVPTLPIPKAPPKPLDEMPPDQKPEGAMVWISGYWAWDDDRKDFLWVSGIWRSTPPDKRWIAGYWSETAGQWQWVPGFWSAAEAKKASHEVAYLPPPPPPPEVAHPGNPPTANSFYVPGSWEWGPNHYVWRAGYWAEVQPGYVWVPAHFRWTPGGYVFIPGYWDMAVEKRGVLYAPVIVHPAAVGVSFVYTPAYVVRETVVVDSLFVRPRYCHYYFGDYYGPAYRDLGFESCVVYSRRHYDPIIVYARWEHRSDPRWETQQLDICLARHAGRAPLPPRTLVQQNVVIQQNITNVNVVKNTTNIYQNTIVQNGPAVVPASQMAAVKKVNTVTLDQSTRLQVKQESQAIQQVAVQRGQTEKISAAPSTQPRMASLAVPPTQPVKPGAASGQQSHPVVAGKSPGTAPATVSPPTNPAAHAASPASPAGPPRPVGAQTPHPTIVGTPFAPGGTRPSNPTSPQRQMPGNGTRPANGQTQPAQQRPQPKPMPKQPDNPPKPSPNNGQAGQGN